MLNKKIIIKLVLSELRENADLRAELKEILEIEDDNTKSN